MDAFDGYRLFIAIQQHFTHDEYNYFLYGGHVKATKTSFQLRQDKYTFHKLVRKYEDLEGFYVANFVYDDPHWSGDLMKPKADQNYKRWLKINNAITKIFKEDLEYILSTKNALAVKDGQNPPALTAVYQNMISIETLLILDEIMPFLNEWNKQVIDPVVWPVYYKKWIKYKPWIQKLNMDKFRKIVKEVLECLDK